MFKLIKNTVKAVFMISIIALKPINSLNITDNNYSNFLSTTQTSTQSSTQSSTQTSNQYNYPIVILHGLESSSEKLTPLCDWIRETFNKIVINIEIGNGEKTSLYTPMPVQLNELCNTIYNNKVLENGFDFIGISQGGLLARGYAEQCNLYPVHNLITLVSPHGGVYFKNKINSGEYYNEFYQSHLSIMNYWRNPILLQTYLEKCIYLPYINNEKPHESSVRNRNNIINLSNFVMIWSKNDEVLAPPESGKFSLYDAQINIIPLEETVFYKNDYLGLKLLNEKDGLHIYETNCTHVDHRNPICFEQLYPIFKQFI
jgi:palmitoyl-protein thioesterase